MPAKPARVEYPDPFAIYRGYPTALLGPDTVVGVKSDDPARDLVRLREGSLRGFAGHAFLSDADTDTLVARLAASGSTSSAQPGTSAPRSATRSTCRWTRS